MGFTPEQIIKVPTISVRLGDDSAVMVRTAVESKLYLGDHHELSVTFFIMKLARGCDVILGFDVMVAYDFTIHPAAKRITALIDSKRVNLATIVANRGAAAHYIDHATDDGDMMDVYLQRANMQQAAKTGQPECPQLTADADAQADSDDDDLICWLPEDGEIRRPSLEPEMTMNSDASATPQDPVARVIATITHELDLTQGTSDSNPGRRDSHFIRNRLWNAGIHTISDLQTATTQSLSRILFVNEGYRSRYRDVPDRLIAAADTVASSPSEEAGTAADLVPTSDTASDLRHRLHSIRTRPYQYRKQKLMMCLRDAWCNALAINAITIDQLEATVDARRAKQTRYTGFRTEALQELATTVYGERQLKTWTHNSSKRPTDWPSTIQTGAIVYSPGHYTAIGKVNDTTWRVIDGRFLGNMQDLDAVGLNKHLNGSGIRNRLHVVFVLPAAAETGKHPPGPYPPPSAATPFRSDHPMWRYIPMPDTAAYDKQVHGSWQVSRQHWTDAQWRQGGYTPRYAVDQNGIQTELHTPDSTSSEHSTTEDDTSAKPRVSFAPQGPLNYCTQHGSLPSEPDEIRAGVYTTARADIECQHIDSQTFQQHLTDFKKGTLTASQFDMESTATTADSHSHRQAQSSSQQHDPRASKHTDPAEEQFFLGTVTFHPDGSFTCLGAATDHIAQQTESYTAADASSIWSGSDNPAGTYRNISIASGFATDNSSAHVDGRVGHAGNSTRQTEDIHAPLTHSQADDIGASTAPTDTSKRQQKIAANRQVDADRKRFTHHSLDWSQDGSTFRCQASVDDTDVLLEGTFPIDESLIDKTHPDMQAWVDDLLHQRLGKFTCLDELVRWEPLPTDPLLNIKAKPGTKPVARRYPVPVNMYPELKKFIVDMLAKNFIRKSTSSWSAPVLIIKKPPAADGSSRGYRFVTDFRALNQCVDPPQYFVPDVQTMYEKLRGAKYISTFDMKNGYWNAGVDDPSTDYLAFTTPWGTYAYQVLPMGFVSSAAHFQNWVEQKLRKHGVLLEYAPLRPAQDQAVAATQQDMQTNDAPDFLQQVLDDDPDGDGDTSQTKPAAADTSTPQLQAQNGFVATYADDIICVSDSEEEHKRHLLTLFRILSTERIFLQTTKSHVACKYVRYLGAIAGNNMLMEDPAKVRAIAKMPMPRNSQTEVRGFLGMTSFWRRWIDGYATKARPLNDLLKKGVDVKKSWSKAHDDAVNELKRSILRYPVLRQYDPTRETRIITDASDYACGAVLAQRHEGAWLPVCFASRTFSGAEKNYSVQEKECLGIIFAVQKFRHYILCSKFKLSIRTDHSSLVFLSKPTNSSGRIARWSMIMSEFDYEIEYIKGTSNVVADQLSRLLELPDSDWINVDKDDDTVHPFLLLFPTLHAIWQMQSATVGDTDDGWAHMEHHLNLDADLIHEQILFTRDTLSTDDAVITFTTQQYLDCPDFSTVYRMFLKADALQQHSHMNMHGDDGDQPPLTQVADDSDTGKSDGMQCDDDDQPPLTQVADGGDTSSKDTHAEPDWNKEERALLSLYRNCFVDQGYLYRIVQGRELLCIPQVQVDGVSTRYDIISLFHDTLWGGHRGVEYTYRALRRRFHWPNMRKDVDKFVSSCDICQMNKKNRRKPQGEMQPLQVPETIAMSYHIDYFTDLPPATEAKYDMLMVIVDRHSHRLFAIPTWKRSTGYIAAEQFYDEICARHGRGVPKEIISDRDVRFTKGFWKRFQERMGVTLRFTTARTQHANGGAERAIATLTELILCFINYEQNNWVSTLPHLLFAANDSPSDALGGRSPLFVEHGQNPLRPLDLHAAMPKMIQDEDIDSRITRLENLRHEVYETIQRRR